MSKGQSKTKSSLWLKFFQFQAFGSGHDPFSSTKFRYRKETNQADLRRLTHADQDPEHCSKPKSPISSVMDQHRPNFHVQISIYIKSKQCRSSYGSFSKIYTVHVGKSDFTFLLVTVLPLHTVSSSHQCQMCKNLQNFVQHIKTPRKKFSLSTFS
jgi:hypothetical protein